MLRLINIASTAKPPAGGDSLAHRALIMHAMDHIRLSWLGCIKAALETCRQEILLLIFVPPCKTFLNFLLIITLNLEENQVLGVNPCHSAFFLQLRRSNPLTFVMGAHQLHYFVLLAFIIQNAYQFADFGLRKFYKIKV